MLPLLDRGRGAAVEIVAKNTFNVKMTGQVLPQTVAASVLGDFITQIEKAILAVIGESQESNPDFALVSLIDVSEGSNRLHFAAPPTVIPAVGAITNAVFTGNFSSIPRKAHEYLYAANRICHRHSWGIEFEANEYYDIRGVTIPPGYLIPEPSKSLMRGTQSVIGRVIRAGGVEPKVHLKQLETDKSFHISVSESIARELAGKLYDIVVLECETFWDTDTWEIDVSRMNVISVAPYYKPLSPSRAFENLRIAANGFWEGENPLAYEHATRVDDEDE